MRTLAALVGIVACCGTFACKSSDDGGSQGTSQAPSCDATEHVVGTACVPNAFDDASMPKTNATDVVKAADGTRYVRERLLLLMNDPIPDDASVRALASANGGEVEGSAPFAGLWAVHLAGVDTESALDAKATAFEADARVQAALRDLVFDDAAIGDTRDPSDTEAIAPGATYTNYFVNPADPASHSVGTAGIWAYESIGVFDAWDAIFFSNPKTTKVVVAVLDGDVDGSPARENIFPLLPFANSNDARIVGNYTTDSYTPTHATAALSIIGAPNDKKGMNGILSGVGCIDYDLAPQAVLGNFDGDTLKKTSSTVSATVMGVILAVRGGARVVSMSLGFYAGPKTTRFANMFRGLFLAAPKALFVMGAGNEGRDAAFFLPAAAVLPEAGSGKTAPNAMSVAAFDEARAPAVWPNIGSTNVATTPGSVTIAAPGKDVLTQSVDGGLTMFNGTSSATPVVAGVAGLIFALHPEWKGEDVERLLTETAAPIDASLGGKKIDAKAAVQQAVDGAPTGGTCSTPTPNECALEDSCVWCATGTLVIDPSLGGGGSYAMQGSFDADWAKPEDLNQADLLLSDTKHAGAQFFATFPPTGEGRTITQTTLIGSTTYPGLGYVSVPGGTSNVSFDALDFKAHFSGATVTGTVVGKRADGSTIATATFHGTLQPSGTSCPLP